MDVYVFVYHAKPTKGSPEHGVVGGAHVDIWIYDSSRELAESRAISYLMDLSWEIIEAERDLIIDDEQIALCPAGALENYLQAKEQGMSALFFAYPSANTDDDVIEFRLIKNPPISGPLTRH